MDACRRELDLLARSLRNDSPHARAVQIGRLVVALGMFATKANMSEGRDADRHIPIHPSVQRGVQIMEQALSEAWTLKTLSARLSNIAPTYLIRLFRIHTGLSPMAYLARHRAERAAALLMHTTRPVKDIGGDVGWDDPNYFARRFKRFFACSPTDYRAKKGRHPHKVDPDGHAASRNSA